MFGTGLIAGSVSLAFIFTPAFIFFNFLELKLVEEPELEMRLGADYREYKKTIPMFFPKISSRTDK
jgi:protein-S-isoprenylcysteine O-methyltransferase Ste14